VLSSVQYFENRRVKPATIYILTYFKYKISTHNEQQFMVTSLTRLLFVIALLLDRGTVRKILLSFSTQDISQFFTTACVGPVAHSVWRLIYRAGRSGIECQWGSRFSSRPDRSWGPPSLLQNGYRVFPGGIKCGRGVLLTTHHNLVPRSWKSRAVPLPTLWAIPGL
jgi:hypothetical protein